MKPDEIATLASKVSASNNSWDGLDETRTGKIEVMYLADISALVEFRPGMSFDDVLEIAAHAAKAQLMLDAGHVYGGTVKIECTANELVYPNCVIGVPMVLRVGAGEPVKAEPEPDFCAVLNKWIESMA